MLRNLAGLTVIAALALAGCGGAGGGEEPDGGRAVTLALDFQPNAVHAGIYAATGEALDRERDIELTVRSPSASTDSLKLLAAGRADLAIVDIHDLGLARERGADVVGVGAIVQRPLAAVIADPRVHRPRDLEGRRVGVTGLPSDEAVLRATVRADGGDPDAVLRTTIGFSAVPSLIAGRVDAVVTFWNAEGVALRERGVRTREFRVDDFGAPRYPELVLATTRATLRRDPDLVRDTIGALAAGTRAALADRSAAARRIATASGADESLVRAQLDAVAPALRPPLRLDRARLEAWASFDARFGILERAPDVDRAFAFHP
jgi:NitT/TauT family transport system substrate-binding protein/putative hydroxymethylpyrimidine transport system substrate-binding protein